MTARAPSTTLRPAQGPLIDADPDHPLATVRWAAERLGVSTSAVHQLVKRGRLRAHRAGPRLLLVNRDQVTTFERRKPGFPSRRRTP